MRVEFEQFPASEPPSIQGPEPAPVPRGGRVWDLLLRCLSPLLFILKWFITAVVVVRLRLRGPYVQSARARCPACGISKKHDMHYAEDYEAVIHTCARCKAEFGIRTVIAPSRWRVVRAQRRDEPEDFGKMG
jgi:hypothetical protein